MRDAARRGARLQTCRVAIRGDIASALPRNPLPQPARGSGAGTTRKAAKAAKEEQPRASALGTKPIQQRALTGRHRTKSPPTRGAFTKAALNRPGGCGRKSASGHPELEPGSITALTCQREPLAHAGTRPALPAELGRYGCPPHLTPALYCTKIQTLAARGGSVLGRKRGTATHFRFSSPFKNQRFAERKLAGCPLFSRSRTCNKGR